MPISQQEFSNYYKLSLNLALKEFKIRYKNARLGFLWAFFYPLFLMFILNIVFTKILSIKMNNYPLFLLTGLFPWTFFTNSISNSTVSLVDNSRLIKKIYFPRSIIPISTVITNAINYIFCIALLLVFIFFLKINISSSIAFLPLILFIQVALIMCISVITSHLFIFFRDVKYLVEILLLILFYATPVFYPLSYVPPNIYPFYILNPMVGIITGYRSIFYEPSSINFFLLGISLSETLILSATAFLVSRKYGPTAADYI